MCLRGGIRCCHELCVMPGHKLAWFDIKVDLLGAFCFRERFGMPSQKKIEHLSIVEWASTGPGVRIWSSMLPVFSHRLPSNPSLFSL